MPAGQLEKLQAEIRAALERFGLSLTAAAKSCYEAGRDGFWLHPYLSAQGVENLIVDSSSIEVDRRARRAKSDRLDVQKLISVLIPYHSGERKVWSVVRAPSVEEEDRRQLHRELKGPKKGLVRIPADLGDEGFVGFHGHLARALQEVRSGGPRHQLFRPALPSLGWKAQVGHTAAVPRSQYGSVSAKYNSGS